MAGIINKKNNIISSFITKWGTLIAIVALFTFFTFHQWGLFLTVDNMIAILRSIAITAVIALGMTFSVAVGGIDLSIGSIATFAMNIVVMMFVWYQMNTFFSISIAILGSLLFGLLNALLIVKLKIPDMLATLAMLFTIDGIAITLTGGGSISPGMIRLDGTSTEGTLSTIFKKLGDAPWIIIIMLVLIAVGAIFFSFTKHGRYIYVVGENREAARLSGISVNNYRVLAYVLSALFAAIGGILLAARLGSAQIGGGAGYLMPSVAATFIGFSVAGAGKANPVGTLAGAILVGILENGLIMESVPYYSMNIVKGAVLALALALTYFVSSSSQKSLL